VGKGQIVLGRKRVKLVGVCDKREAGQFRRLPGRQFGKALRRVKPCADRGSAQRQPVKSFTGAFHLRK